jgi:hypothetical protein
MIQRIRSRFCVGDVLVLSALALSPIVIVAWQWL